MNCYDITDPGLVVMDAQDVEIMTSLPKNLKPALAPGFFVRGNFLRSVKCLFRSGR